MELKIIKMGINGEGIGYVDKKPVFVPKALPEEVVEVKIVERKSHYFNAELVKIKEASRYRINAVCDHQDECGGCPLMVMKYNPQMKYKREILKQTLIKYAQINPELIEMMVPSKNNCYYRNSCKMPIQSVDGKLMCGMYQAGSNRFVPIKRCLVHEKGLERIRKEVLYVLNDCHLNAFDKKSQRGIRYLCIRGFNDKYQVTIVTGKEKLDEQVVERLISIKGLVSLYQNVNMDIKSVEIMSNQFRHLKGAKRLLFDIEGFKGALYPDSFFQLNTEQAMKMYQVVVDMLKPCDHLVEAYCGIGAMGIMAKDKATKVTGIDSIKDAVKNAEENAYLNKAENVKFVCGDSGEMLAKMKEKVDALIVDPPRTGLDETMMNALLEKNIPQVIYISCNPATLAKNLEVLKEVYTIERIVPFDLFPATAKIETIVSLTKK
ncbi:MAG: 23S rRNA (uracil(1939)-C(5))-methyltransferase RlmD [Erysipelotrichaceae bacterium]|nr:23S rRNA (uracil(1939)-C(5))-methyltransferase RlmD [Erysipelotrichaceae bacterium]